MAAFQSALEALTDDRWNALTTQEKLNTLQAIENEVAEREGRASCQVSGRYIPSTPEGVTLGYYNRGMRDITINTEQLMEQSQYGNDYRVHLDTVLHEGRHAYQHQAVMGEIIHAEPEQVKAWADNMAPGHYITFERNPRAYAAQPIERDAREFARDAAFAIEQERDALLEKLSMNREPASGASAEELTGREQIEAQMEQGRASERGPDRAGAQRDEIERQSQASEREGYGRGNSMREEIEAQMAGGGAHAQEQTRGAEQSRGRGY